MRQFLLFLLIALSLNNSNAEVKIIKKVPPEFPEEAQRKKVSEGVIKARLTIDGTGNVTNVEVVEASPPKAKVFSQAATDALIKWKFEATNKTETFEVKLVFSEE